MLRLNTPLSAVPIPSESMKPVVAFEADLVRRSIMLSYWLIILLGVPLWWQTTSIERQSLPISTISRQADSKLVFPVSFLVKDNLGSDVSITSLQYLLREKVVADPLRWDGLDMRFISEMASEISCEYNLEIGDIQSRPLIKDRQILYPVKGAIVSAALVDTIADLVVPPPQAHTAPYSPRYRLSFSLLNEDAAAGPSISAWDVRSAIIRHINPLLSSLSALHNFTIESQVQFYAPLAFEPRQLEVGTGLGLTTEDLTVFVNSAEWTLSSSISNDPVLHFILFVPSSVRRPLHIINKHGVPSSSTMFLLPQWGGIFIHNPPASMDVSTEMTAEDLDVPFAAFEGHLRSLLGVPPLPKGVEVASSDSESPQVITSFQLDALLRRRALENTKNAQDTLSSIIRLVAQIPDMPVGSLVRGDVFDALAALEKVYKRTVALETVIAESARALVLSSRAFFNPGMLALLYFPAEHKYAVYAPLFASALVPLVAAAVREFAAWNNARRKRGVVSHASKEE